jgi:hypothetical protein
MARGMFRFPPMLGDPDFNTWKAAMEYLIAYPSQPDPGRSCPYSEFPAATSPAPVLVADAHDPSGLDLDNPDQAASPPRGLPGALPS